MQNKGEFEGLEDKARSRAFRTFILTIAKHCLCWSPCFILYSFYSVQFSCSVLFDSLPPHELQHARPPCPSPTPGGHSNSCPSSQWCHPAISSSVIPFSSCPQSLPASGSFPMSQLFAWGGQSIGVSASASVLPMNTQNWSPLEWTDIICIIMCIENRKKWKNRSQNNLHTQVHITWKHVEYIFLKKKELALRKANSTCPSSSLFFSPNKLTQLCHFFKVKSLLWVWE